MSKNKIRLGISHGDINGISYEIIIKSLLDNRIFDFFTPIIFGSSKIAAYHRKALSTLNLNLVSIKSTESLNLKRANIINCIENNTKVELGLSTEMAGKASLTALELAVSNLMNKKIDVLVTAPINKQNIQSNKFNFPGHTEYLEKKFDVENSLMLMINEKIRVGVVTGHIPLSKVAESISTKLILEKLRILQNSLIRDFAITKPKIAVLSLNPHAGDNGLLGSEENEIIIPSIKIAREEEILAFGPYPADGFFGSFSYDKFDAVLAMYHDQGLAPFKSIVFDKGVNYTAGLPFVRTSPAHGTAYEIAGKNIASPNSFREAMYLACDIFNNRNKYDELTKNKLTTSQGNFQMQS